MLELQGDKVNGFASLEELKAYLEDKIKILEELKPYYSFDIDNENVDNINILISDIKYDLESLNVIVLEDSTFRFKTVRERLMAASEELLNPELDDKQINDLCITINRLREELNSGKDYSKYTKLYNYSYYE